MSEAEDSFLDLPFLRYAVAAVVVVAASLLRLAIVRTIGAELPPFITFYPSIMVVALLCGLWPGLLATALAALAADYWILPPGGSFAIAKLSDAISLAFFAAMGVFLSLVADAYRRNQQRLATLKRELAVRETQEKLRRSEEQFETLANAIPQLCWMANPDGWIFWYNQRWYAYTGTTPEQMEGWSWQSVHDPETLPMVLERWKASIASGEPLDMVFPLRGADGVFRPFLTRVMPVKDADGKIVRWFGTNTDIGEQKRVETELRKSKERLGLALEVAGLGEWELDPKDHTASRSLRHDQIFGYSSLLPEWSYEIFLAHVLPEHRAEVDEKFKASLAGGTWDFETQIRRADGEVRWIWARGRCRTDEMGQPNRMFGIVTDITERKQAEDSLREQAELIEIDHDAIMVRGLDGTISFWNHGAEEMYGFSKLQAVGRISHELLHTVLPKPLGEIESDVLRVGRWEGDLIHTAQDGKRIVVASRWVAQRDESGQACGVMEINNDITERRHAEEELQEAEERIRLMVENVQDYAIFMLDTDGHIITWNAGAQQMKGYRADEILGEHFSRFYTPEDIAAGKPQQELAIALEQGKYSEEGWRVRQDGSRFEASVTITAIHDAAGQFRGFAKITRDITERKHAEEELRSSQAKLQGVVGSAMDAIISVDDEQRIVVFNQAAEAIFQCVASEAIGSTPDRFIPQNLREVHREHIRQFGNQGVTNRSMTAPGNLTGVRSNGEEFPIEATISQVRANGETLYTVILRDVTERRQAEEALRRQAEMLRLSFDAIIVWRLGVGIESWNRGAQELYGYREDEALNRITHELLGTIHSVPWPEIEAALHRYGSWEGELHHFTKDGREVTVESRHQLIVGSDGIERILETNRDITERKQAEEALRLRIEALNAAANSIVMTDRQGNIEWVNAAFTKLTGYSAAEAIGQNPRVLKSGKHEDQFYKNMWNSVLSGSTWRGEVINRRKDASLYVEEMTITPVRSADGNISKFLAVKEDITERKQAEQALQASEHRWATTLHSIGDAVISTDSAGNIEFMNAVAERLTGWTLPDAKGRHLTEVFDIVQEVTRIKPENPVEKVIRMGKVVGLANHTALIRRDGAEIPIEDSAAPIRDSLGQMEGVVLVFHDCLEQRKVEAALRSSERLATTGRLAATIAHEIHNPLDAVGNLLYLIGHDSQEAATKEYASTASAELGRVTQMTQQMLAFQREASRPVPVKIGEIMANVVALYERKLKTAGIHVEQRIEFDGHILLMPGELRQILANLLGNAIEAVGPRQGTIHLRAYASKDRRRGLNGLCVVVADNGPGIPTEVRSKIFEPFFTTKGESGTGLGLWITSDILRKYDGTMRVRSCTRPGRSGTCFSIFFPFEIGSNSPEL